jgi:hypothetical protein
MRPATKVRRSPALSLVGSPSHNGTNSEAKTVTADDARQFDARRAAEDE